MTIMENIMNTLLLLLVLILTPTLSFFSLFLYYKEDKKKIYRNEVHKYIDEVL